MKKLLPTLIILLETPAVLSADPDAAPDSPATFRTLSLNNNLSCGVRTDGAVTCWGRDDHGQTDAPDGAFKYVVAGERRACAIGEGDGEKGGTITCWGQGDSALLDPPEGAYVSVPMAETHACAIRDDAKDRETGLVDCWGSDYENKASPPRPPRPPKSATSPTSVSSPTSSPTRTTAAVSRSFPTAFACTPPRTNSTTAGRSPGRWLCR